MEWAEFSPPTRYAAAGQAVRFPSTGMHSFYLEVHFDEISTVSPTKKRSSAEDHDEP
jgi:hypothetical protein